LSYLAEAHAELGNRQSARECADRSVDLATLFGNKRFELQCRWARAGVLLRDSDASARAAAAAELEAADAIRKEIDAHAFEPMIDMLRAELARLGGDEAGREAALRRAYRRFREMGMTGRAERAARELGSAPATGGAGELTY